MPSRPLMSIMGGLLLSGLTSCSEPAGEPDAGILDLAVQTRNARLAGDAPEWLALGLATLARAPEHPDLLISVARAHAANGRAGNAVPYLEQAIARGAGFDLAAIPEFTEHAGDVAFAALATAAKQNLEPVAPAEVFVVIEDTNIQPEGIAWDPQTSRLFISSFNGAIWQVGTDGAIAPFAGPDAGLREVAGLKVDPGRRLLWAASSVFPDAFGIEGEPKPDAGLTAVFAFDLDSGRKLRECPLDERPAMHGFNDMALAANGDVYVSDSPASIVWMLPAGECRLERVLHDSRMGFPNGIALSADDTRLYVAHIEGLSVIDLNSRRRTQLEVPADAAVNSMDGLVRDGHDLIGIQPSPFLARAIRIRLGDDGRSVAGVTIVSSRPPVEQSQATGTVAGAHYYSVAGSLDALQPGGGDARARILRAGLR